MTIVDIRRNLNDKVGDDVKIVCNGSRNRVDEYRGRITEIYNYIFIVKLDSDEVKSFCYSDVLTKTIQLFFDMDEE